MLEFDPGLVLWTLITFAVLLFILSKTAWPKILSALEERETRIRSALTDAEEAKQEAERAKADYNELLKKAKREATEIVRKSTERAEKVREDLLLIAKKDAEAIVEKTRNELELEREKAVSELKDRAVELSVAISAKIITSTLTPDQQAELAHQAIKDMESTL